MSADAIRQRHSGRTGNLLKRTFAPPNSELDILANQGNPGPLGALLLDGELSGEALAVSTLRLEPRAGGAALTHPAFDPTCGQGVLREELCRYKNKAQVIDLAGAGGVTPLMLASQNGFSRCARELIERKADVNAKQESGRTPLMFASYSGFDSVAKILLHHRAGAKRFLGI